MIKGVFDWFAGKILFLVGVALAITMILNVPTLRELAMWVNGWLATHILNYLGLSFFDNIGGNRVLATLLIVVWVFLIALMARFVIVKIAKIVFGFTDHKIASGLLSWLASVIAIVGNLYMACFAYSKLYAVDVTVPFLAYTFKGYRYGSTILYVDGIDIGIVTVVYLLTQLLPLAFEPSKYLIGRFIDVLFSLPFAVVISLTLIAWLFKSYPGASSTYLTGALKVWGVAVVIDLLHIVIMAWQWRLRKERDEARTGIVPTTPATPAAHTA